MEKKKFLLQAISFKIICNSDRKCMPLGNFTCVLRTQFKEVLDVLFCYSLIKRNDVIPSYKIWISVGMNNVNYDADKYTY